MSHVTSYELLGAGDSRSLTAMVNEKIAEGWQPFGSPFARSNDVFQAMVQTNMTEKRIRKNSEDER